MTEAELQHLRSQITYCRQAGINLFPLASAEKLVAAVERLRTLNASLAERVAGQNEALGRRAEGSAKCAHSKTTHSTDDCPSWFE